MEWQKTLTVAAYRRHDLCLDGVTENTDSYCLQKTGSALSGSDRKKNMRTKLWNHTALHWHSSFKSYEHSKLRVLWKWGICHSRDWNFCTKDWDLLLAWADGQCPTFQSGLWHLMIICERQFCQKCRIKRRWICWFRVKVMTPHPPTWKRNLLHRVLLLPHYPFKSVYLQGACGYK
jgi:hypothetical protein